MDMVRDELGLLKRNLMDEPKRLELYDNQPLATLLLVSAHMTPEGAETSPPVATPLPPGSDASPSNPHRPLQTSSVWSPVAIMPAS